MPTYTYECTKCGTHFDLFHSITDESEKHCPECQGEARRVISGGIGVIFKGSGWYQTDYKGKNPAINGNGNGHHHHADHDHGSNGYCETCPHHEPESKKSDAKSETKKDKSTT